MCRNPGKANKFRAKLITFRTAVIIILIQPHLVPKIRRSSSEGRRRGARGRALPLGSRRAPSPWQWGLFGARTSAPMGALWGHHPKPSAPPCPWGRAMRPGHPRVTHGKIYISSITGCFGDAWRENSGVVQDEAPSPPWLTPNLNEPPRRHLWRTLILTHSSRIPSPHRPPNPGAPRAWHRRGGRWWRWQPWWWHGARSPPGLPGDAGSCGRSWRAQP